MKVETTVEPKSREPFVVKPERDGFTIYTRDGWGLGHTFTHVEYANAACRCLNDNAALDAHTGS